MQIPNSIPKCSFITTQLNKIKNQTHQDPKPRIIEKTIRQKPAQQQHFQENATQSRKLPQEEQDPQFPSKADTQTQTDPETETTLDTKTQSVKHK